MHLAILHYHLNLGGVSQVIRGQMRALAAAGAAGQVERAIVLFGGRCAAWPDGPEAGNEAIEPEPVSLPELEYDDPTASSPADPVGLAKAIAGELNSKGLRPDDTVLHVHNHALGKNVSLPGALAELARDGYRLLLQIHDFAEDFRPDNYRRFVDSGVLDGLGLYPQAPNIHYAVLNARDNAILERAGVERKRLHMLPNPVVPFGELPSPEQARKQLAERLDVSVDQNYLLYPVRGIRRKNVGEMVLWSALLGNAAVPAITLRPQNPAEAASYDRWRALAAKLGLLCRFGVGEEGGLTFHENLAAADALMTTSVAEGFGMVFLEASLAVRPLIGRDLPEITADFRASGVKLPWLYDRLAVPIEMIDASAARDRLGTSYRAACHDYGQTPVSESVFKRIFERLTVGNAIDFAYLGGPVQAEIVSRVVSDPVTRDALLERNPAIASAASLEKLESTSAILARNSAVVERQYGLVASGKRLLELYGTILAPFHDSALAALPHDDTILPSFLTPQRLQPIRLEP